MTLTYRVGILGSNADPLVPWTLETLLGLREQGFNTMQLNIAWGPRPADEPLNLEDVISLPPEQASRWPQHIPLRSDQTPSRVTRRQADLKQRIAVCPVSYTHLTLPTIY